MKKYSRLKDLSFNDIENLINLIDDKFKESRNKRGRPRKYSDKFILVLLFYKTIHNLSFRDLRFFMIEIFGYSPAISTIHYRFSKLSISVLEELFNRIVSELVGKEVELFIPDGTGFGYDGMYRLNWMRGKEIREVSSHVKTVVVVVRDKDGRDVVYRVSTGPPYSDERRLVEPLIKRAGVRAKVVLADGLYGMGIKILKEFKEIGTKVIVPIKDGVWNRVRHPIRREVMEIYKRERGIYKKRYIVEQVIGKVKNAYGRCEGARKLENAIKFVWMKFIAYNYWVLIRSYFICRYLRGLWDIMAGSIVIIG